MVEEGSTDNGSVANCTGNKNSDDSALRVTFNGNIRVTDCHDCCMRWYITMNGEECTDPAPIEAIIYSTDAAQVNVHRAATITGKQHINEFNFMYNI